MQSLFRSFSSSVLAVAALFGLSACTLVQNSSPAQFYVLSAELPQGQQPLFAPGAPAAPILVVGTVRVSAFLDRPQVTTRREDNRVSFDEFVRWAEPLSDGVARVLRTNFVTLLGTPESALPWVRASNRDFNLFVFLEDIQLRDDKQLELRLSFRMSDGSNGQIVLAGERTYLSPAPQEESGNAFYAALAELISQQIGVFAVDIARDAATLKAERSAEQPATAADPAVAAGAQSAGDATPAQGVAGSAQSAANSPTATAPAQSASASGSQQAAATASAAQTTQPATEQTSAAAR